MGKEGEAATAGRGQVTRQKLLDCAIELIAQRGYAATTTQAILDLSGISRGSLLHQFPTRHELMVTAGKTALEQMLARIRAAMAQTGSPLEGMFRYPDILWDAMIEPPALAYYEIQMASRWDADLLDGLRKAINDGENYVEATVRAMARRYRMADVDSYLVDLSVVNDAFPNLAARRDLTSNPARITAERNRLRAWHDEALRSRLPEEFHWSGKAAE